MLRVQASKLVEGSSPSKCAASGIPDRPSHVLEAERQGVEQLFDVRGDGSSINLRQRGRAV